MKTERKKVFSYPRDVVRTVFCQIIFCVVMTIIHQLEFWWFFIIFAVTLMILIITPSYRNTFTIITFDENGIKNKFFLLKWEEVTSYKLCNTYSFRGNFFKPPKYGPTIISFGEHKDDFTKQSPTECIMLSASGKTLDLLYKYGYKKSQGIRDLFAENSFDFGEDKNFPRN